MTTKKSRAIPTTNRGLRPKVLEFLHKHPGVEVFASDLAEVTGTDTRAIQSCLSNYLREATPVDLQVVVRGNSWRYLPNGKPSAPKGSDAKRVFEELATTKAGELLIQDEAGTVYLAREL